ncbi:similar to Saccharomyces cerevisiae YIL152W Putative protein of unknown function [Maudiozyma saulgeensis]|uniref:Uncharacterized protein n=1 Tax=Maudiozyma saulgeensis TaxID=1789683 RepID=A0A1X7QXJ6_9SACH|nr:similar to Saccharomyces cerevisiae YIL152W Putative protein of unknown function [Kazachstania saulgeensis]
MKRRGFVRSPAENRLIDQKEITSMTEFRLPLSKQRENISVAIPFNQLRRSIQLKNTKTPLKSQNVNISTVMSAIALKKNNCRKTQIAHKTSSITSIVKQVNERNRYNQSKIIKKSTLNDILADSKIKETDTTLKYSSISYNDYIKKPPIKESPELYQHSMLSTLQVSLWQFHSKLKLLDVHDKSKYDALLSIHNIKALSSNETMVITPHEKYNLILHNTRKDQNIPKSERIQNYKLAVNSKATIKLSDTLRWCLQWKFIPLNA